MKKNKTIYIEISEPYWKRCLIAISLLLGKKRLYGPTISVNVSGLKLVQDK